MNVLLIRIFSAADPFVGKIDKFSLSQQTLMELLIQNISNKEKICGSQENPKDISEWDGVTLNDSNEVTEIFWCFQYLRGSIELKWLPETVTEVNVQGNSLKGTVDFTTLPRGLKILKLSGNRFDGTVNLTKLPDGITDLYLNRNSFFGETDFSQLPGSLVTLLLAGTDLKGEIFKLDGYLDVEESELKDMRKKKNLW